jgi:hypothetical protein
MAIVKIHNYLGMVAPITYGSQFTSSYVVWCIDLSRPRNLFRQLVEYLDQHLKGFPVLRPTWNLSISGFHCRLRQAVPVPGAARAD